MIEFDYEERELEIAEYDRKRPLTVHEFGGAWILCKESRCAPILSAPTLYLLSVEIMVNPNFTGEELEQISESIEEHVRGMESEVSAIRYALGKIYDR